MNFRNSRWKTWAIIVGFFIALIGAVIYDNNLTPSDRVKLIGVDDRGCKTYIITSYNTTYTTCPKNLVVIQNGDRMNEHQ